ncbi:MAG: class I SAM-dependent methyltransferase [Alphaproteobacteria bacterium]|nr:MAG: class I SAM-dependent methyltransferase [Alphaproteobacteria bacterium]
MSTDTSETWFGFRRVEAREKPRLVRGVFDSVAARYDLMNDLMSGGVHRVWKDGMVGWLAPRGAGVHLDVAGGTGDIAFRIARRAPEKTVLVCDLTPAMLEVGRDRALNGALGGDVGRVRWVAGDAQSLPLPDRSVDAYTIAFGLRNVTDIDRALAEARRVLRPGGRFLCLEFSHVTVPGLDRLYDLFSFQVLPRLGAVVARDRESYQYLVESIRRFPAQQELAERMAAAGLRRVQVRNLSGGIAALHSGWRL